MNKPFKNLLQEYYQKKQLNVPTYSTFSIANNIGNIPLWKSIVMLYDGTEFVGISGDLHKKIPGNKKDAENNAAKNAYNYLITSNKLTTTTTTISTTQKAKSLNDINIANFKKVLLVDSENCDLEINKISNDMLVLMFVSKNTTKKVVFQLQNKYENCYVFISESVGRDAADHLLTFYAGKLSILYDEMQYYVLTKDHYGEFLEKFMSRCRFICSLDEIMC